jgi:hypothetical protein
MSPLLFIVLLAALRIIIISCTHLSFLLLPSRRKSYKEAARREQKEKPVAEKPDRVSADFAALIDAITDEGKAYRAEEESEDTAKRFREWLTILLIACTFIAIGWQVSEMIKVYGPIKEQADAVGDTEARQLRAYVYSVITSPEPSFLPNVENRFSVSFINGGATPAYDPTVASYRCLWTSRSSNTTHDRR